MDLKTKIALIGAGNWGKKLLKEFSTQADVLYVCYKDNSETKKFLEENYPGIKHTTSVDEALQDSSVEAVVIATPINTHKEIALKAISAGKHVFLEKPGGKNSKELEEICEAAEKKGVILAVGYEFVHHPAWQKILGELSASDVRSVHMEWFKWGTFDYDAVTNLLCHDISILQCLTSKIEVERSQTFKVISDTDIVEAEFDCGEFKATSYINRASPEKQKTITVVGKEKTFVWNGNELQTIDNTSKVLTSIEISKETPVASEISEFLSSVKERKEPKVNGKFALAVYKTLDLVLN